MVCIQIKLEKIILIKALLKKQGIKSNVISKLNWWPLSTIRKILQIINIYFLGHNRKSFFNDAVGTQDVHTLMYGNDVHSQGNSRKSR